jgi:hypothetical protein
VLLAGKISADFSSEFLKNMWNSKKSENFAKILEPWAQSYQPKIPEKLSVFCTDFQIPKKAN